MFFLVLVEHILFMNCDVILKTDLDLISSLNQEKQLVATAWALTATLCWLDCPMKNEEDTLRLTKYKSPSGKCSCYWTDRPRMTASYFREQRTRVMYESRCPTVLLSFDIN